MSIGQAFIDLMLDEHNKECTEEDSMGVVFQGECRICGRAGTFEHHSFICGRHKPKPDENDLMRERSGQVNIDSRLVSFLYSLMRDHVQPGDVESLVREACIESNVQYTNGWLAKYAEDIAKRLSPILVDSAQ